MPAHGARDASARVPWHQTPGRDWRWHRVNPGVFFRTVSRCHADSRHLSRPRKDLGTRLAVHAGRSRPAKVETLIHILTAFLPRHEQTGKMIGYFDGNWERMDCQSFRDQGRASSAAVETGHRNITGTRPKRGGMHWSKVGANKIVALRAYTISGRCDDFWHEKANNS